MPVLFPTTLVGSYPQPGWLIDHERLTVPRVPTPDLWLVPPERLEEAQDDAVRLAVEAQLAAGIDVLTDGESRRESYSVRFAGSLDGIDLLHPGSAPGRGAAGRPMVVPRVVGPIGRSGPVEVSEVRFLRSLTDRQIKVTLPGPFTMSQQAEDDYYNDEAALAMAYAPAVNEEARDLFAAGADMVQIDEPFMAARPDKARAFGLSAFEAAIEGLTGTTAVHLCFGYAALVADRPAAYPFLEELASTAVDEISIETAQSGLDSAVLERLGDKTVILGVLDLSSHDVEAPDVVVARVERALAHVAPERLVLAPDCGMKFLPRDAAAGKLASLGEAARTLRARFGDHGGAR